MKINMSNTFSVNYLVKLLIMVKKTPEILLNKYHVQSLNKIYSLK